MNEEEFQFTEDKDNVSFSVLFFYFKFYLSLLQRNLIYLMML